MRTHGTLHRRPAPDLGDGTVSRELFERFVHRLIALARARLPESLRCKEDPEDVVQSVFRSFFRRQQAGELHLESWENVWSILVVITIRKCSNRRARFTALRRDLRREQPMDGNGAATWELVSDEPTPTQAAVLSDLVAALAEQVDAEDQEILRLHLQSFTVPEIASQVGLSERTIWRTLGRIRRRARQLLSRDVRN